MALMTTPPVSESSICPDFSLLSVNPRDQKKIFTRADFFPKINPQPVLVMFICNHCPYVIAIEERLITLSLDLAKLKIPVVAICSNDAKEYPADSFENLQKRYLEKNLKFSYLHDPTQKAAKDFGAVCTPDFFLYDKTGVLKYRGRLDDSWKDPSKVTRRDLYEYAKALSEGRPAPFEQVYSQGCSIKWIK